MKTDLLCCTVSSKEKMVRSKKKEGKEIRKHLEKDEGVQKLRKKPVLKYIYLNFSLRKPYFGQAFEF